MMRTLPLLLLTSALTASHLPSCNAFFFGRCRLDSAAEKCGFLRLAVVQHVGTPETNSCEESCVYFESSRLDCGGCGNIDPQSPSSEIVPSPLPPDVPTQSPVTAPSEIPPQPVFTPVAAPVASPVAAPVPMEFPLPVTGPIPVPVGVPNVPSKSPTLPIPVNVPTKSPTKTPTKAPTLLYNIDLDLFNISASDTSFFTNSKLQWESIIRGDLPSFSTTGLKPPAEGCKYPSMVDDLYICARYVPIDGKFGVLGSAGPVLIRGSNQLTRTGDMEFDSADIDFLKSRGSFGSVILHEIGHILGIGTLWELKNVTGPETSNCPYYGPRANAEYKNITGCDVVPTENSGKINDGTFCGHWDEECMKSELMTGFLNGGLNPLSRITIATLDDLGYTVDYSTAESYGRNDVNSTCTCGGRRLLSESTKLNTANQLGTSHISTRRRSLSEEGYQGAVNYGQAILLQRRLAKKVSILANSIGMPDDIVYVGDKVLVVFVEEDGAFFDVTVTLQ